MGGAASAGSGRCARVGDLAAVGRDDLAIAVSGQNVPAQPF